MKAINDVLVSRAESLERHIKEDKGWYDDKFLGYFMRGRVYIEEMWLAETKRFIEAGNLTPDSMLKVLEERRAIIKTYMTEEKTLFNTTDGQEMRGRSVINGHWLEETEKLIKILEQIRG